MALYQPIYDKRVPVISGDEDVKLTEEEEKAIPEEALESKDGQKGIPGFWLQALGQNEDIREFIEEEDLPLMEKLKDITVTYNENFDSFTLTFCFHPNEYMEQTELKKTYTVSPDLIDEESPALTGIDYTEIKWKAGKDLTVAEVKKRQKVKKGQNKGQTRTITKIEPKMSFFWYFKENRDDDDDDDMDSDDDGFERKPGFTAEEDYDVGHAIRTTVVPEALYWFTGENGFSEDDEDEDAEEDDDDNDDDEGEEEEEEEEEAGGAKGRKGKAKGDHLPKFEFDAPPPPPGQDGANPECKQT